MSMPAAPRCTTSRPGWSDQIRRPSSFLCLRVNRLPFRAPVVVLFVIPATHPRHEFSQAWPGRDSLTNSLQRGRPTPFEAAAANHTIARTRAILVYGQERTSDTSAIACHALLLSFSPSFRFARRAAASVTRFGATSGAPPGSREGGKRKSGVHVVQRSQGGPKESIPVSKAKYIVSEVR
jgi:hypothetical protein